MDGRSKSSGQSIRYTGMFVAGKLVVRTEKAYTRLPTVSPAFGTPRTGFVPGGARRTDAYKGMYARISWPRFASSCTKAPTTSESPPVFANGMISELRMQILSGAIARV